MDAIRIENASVYLSGREVLHGINWRVEQGERCFILGANGAGKTTLVRMLMGYAWPLFGATVEVLGHRFGTINLQELRKRIAWVSPLMHQWLGQRDWTGREMVLSGPDATIGLFRTPTAAEEARAAELLASLRAEHLADRTVATMSSGEQVKVLIARALMTRPDLMILDEPSVFLDIAGREFLLGAISDLAAQRQTHHHLHHPAHRGHPARLLARPHPAGGNIIARGSREEVLTEPILRRTFDLPIRLIKAANGRLWSIMD